MIQRNLWKIDGEDLHCTRNKFEHAGKKEQGKEKKIGKENEKEKEKVLEKKIGKIARKGQIRQPWAEIMCQLNKEESWICFQ